MYTHHIHTLIQKHWTNKHNCSYTFVCACTHTHRHRRTKSWLVQKNYIFKSRYSWHMSLWASALQWIPRHLHENLMEAGRRGLSKAPISSTGQHPVLQVGSLREQHEILRSALGLSTYWSLCLLTRGLSRVLRQGCIFCSNPLCFVLISNLWQQHQEMKGQTQTY